MNASKVIPNMTGRAVKCGQCLRRHNVVRIGSRFYPKRSDNRLNLSIFEVEPGTSGEGAKMKLAAEREVAAIPARLM